jgi:hypothetical protein
MTGIGNVAGFCLFLHWSSCRLFIACVRNYRRERIHPSKCDLTAFADLMCNKFEYLSNMLVAQKNPRVRGFLDLQNLSLELSYRQQIPQAGYGCWPPFNVG